VLTFGKGEREIRELCMMGSSSIPRVVELMEKNRVSECAGVINEEQE
jgi:hypothetical protein